MIDFRIGVRTMVFRKLMLVMLLAISMVGCQQQIPQSSSDDTNGETIVEDRLKRQVRFQSLPQRIVSLTPASTELLFAIGAGAQVVGVTNSCDYPDEVKKLTRVGAGPLQSLNREVIVGLKPDLVLCKADNHEPLIETLGQFNVACFAIGAESLEELYLEAATLGKITGHENEAAALSSQLKRRVEQLTARVKLIPVDNRRSVFYELWDEPLMTAGPESFIGQTLTLAGLNNIFSDSQATYPAVSQEVVVSRNPDLIISPSTHANQVRVEKLMTRQGWAEVNAIKDKQVYTINGDHISRCGPRLLDALEEIISHAYPEHITRNTTEERTP